MSKESGQVGLKSLKVETFNRLVDRWEPNPPEVLLW